jgi:hypothetical protein
MSSTLSAIPDSRCQDRVPLYKPHGTLTHANQPVGLGGLVITQFDYFQMVANYRKMLQQTMTGFSRCCVLIIGYSFGDMDIGAELYTLHGQQPSIPWYAVFPRNDPQVRSMYSTQLGIHQVNRTFEEFLAELDERVNFIPSEFKHNKKNELRANSIIQ